MYPAPNMMLFMAHEYMLMFAIAAQEHSMVVPTIARNVIVGGVTLIGTLTNSRKPRKEYSIMAKQARNVRLEIAAELLKLEAKLNEGIDPRNGLRLDELAHEAIKEARDFLLER